MTDTTDDKIVILVVEQQPSSTIVVEGGTTVIATDDTPSVLVAAEQGPAGKTGDVGPPGPAGGTAFTRVAAANVSGGKALTLNAAGECLHADGADMTMANRVAGIALNGGLPGDLITIVVTGGEIDEPTWNWIEGNPIFLGPDGALTQVAPSTGFVLVIGVAVGPTRILVKIQQPIFIA